MLKQTRNRKAILKCLTEPNVDCGGQPPYSASDVHYMLEHGFKWYGASKPVSISQINRTLRDLLKAGVIIRSSRIDEPFETGLPRLVNYYQLAGAVDRNELKREINLALRAAGQVHGTFLFSTEHFFTEPFDPAPVIADIKALMQRVQPDKTPGYESEFDQLNKALKYCRSKVDLLKNPGKRLNLDR